MKKRKVEQLETLDFDPGARQEYLTGFHKRKVARKKAAQETAVKKDREDRIRQRKDVRTTDMPEFHAHVAYRSVDSGAAKGGARIACRAGQRATQKGPSGCQGLW